MKQTTTILAVVIAVASLVGLGVMWHAEPISTDAFNYANYKENILPGLKQYALALGALLLTVSVSYILLGRENNIATKADEPD